MSCQDKSKLNIPGINLTWIASTWSSRVGQMVWRTFLDSCWLLWPGTTMWPLHKGHSGNIKLLKISKLWHEFKISPSSLICAIYVFLSKFFLWILNSYLLPFSYSCEPRLQFIWMISANFPFVTLTWAVLCHTLKGRYHLVVRSLGSFSTHFKGMSFNGVMC